MVYLAFKRTLTIYVLYLLNNRMYSLFLTDIFIFNHTVAEAIFYLFNTVFIGILASICVSLYFFLRPKFRARVNCWFCNRTFWVPFADRNCFECLYCDQYNGFTDDGDYNADLFGRKKFINNSFECENLKSPSQEVTNGLCNACNVNQQLKVQQLADFTPMNEDNYDAEIDHFKQQLEKYYRLCDECTSLVAVTLQTQHYKLLTQRLNGHCPNGSPEGSSTTSLRVRAASALRTISAFCLAYVCGYSTCPLMSQVLDNWVPNISQVFQNNIWTWWPGCKYISALGAATCFSLSVTQVGWQNYYRFAAWVVILGLAWTPYSIFLPFFTATGLVLHFIPLKKVQTRTQNIFTAVPVMTTQTTPLSEIVKNSVRPPKENNNLKSPPQQAEPKKSKKTTRVEEKKETPRRIETRSQKRLEVAADLKMKSEDVEGESAPPKQVRSRLFSPPPEVYKGFNSLRLGSVEPMPRGKPPDKPANYLFESLDFGNKKETKSLIKPAKFTVNSSRHYSTPSPFVEEVAPSQKSSTPSNRDSFSDLNVSTLSPLSGKWTPPGPYQCDYDYNSYGPHPSYLTPMGHTTVYTYTRPATYPYNFPPQRFSPAFASPCDGPFSPGLSDLYSSSHSGNMSSFSSLQGSQKWTWLKRGLYVTSVLLNVLTMVLLAFSFWKS